MLELSRGLPARSLDALADLERRVLAADGGRLKLEWRTLRGRRGVDVEDVLSWDGDRLQGFVGLYSFGAATTVELAGMVDPAARRQGIATALIDAALPLCVEQGRTQALLVVPRTSAAGAALAQARGARLEHSEHALVLEGSPQDGPEDPDVTVRRARPDDVPVVNTIFAEAFGHHSDLGPDQVADEAEPLLVVETGGQVIGTVRLTMVDHRGGVYGFAIRPGYQGRGIGRDVLRRICRRLRDEGAHRVGLEVAAENDRALGLYTSVGFTRVITEDYWELPLP